MTPLAVFECKRDGMGCRVLQHIQIVQQRRARPNGWKEKAKSE